MVKKYYQIPLILLFAFTFISCSVATKTTTPYLIKFDNKNYIPTRVSEIIIYSSRIDIPQKYIEIGTIKFEGEVDILQIKDMAAKNGASALLKEGNNYILLFYTDQKKGKENDKTI